jgi:hypothetical protein
MDTTIHGYDPASHAVQEINGPRQQHHPKTGFMHSWTVRRERDQTMHRDWNRRGASVMADIFG